MSRQLNEKQMKAISLLAKPNRGGLQLDEIAQKAGVSRQTLYGWRQNATFKEELKKQTDRVQNREEQKKDIYLYDYQKYELKKVSLSSLKENKNMKADSGLPREEFLMAFNKNNVNYFTTIPEVSRPHILIEYSQNKDLSQSQLMPFKEGNKIISDLIKDRSGSAGFDKVRYNLVYPKGINGNKEMSVVSMERLDIGDGMYSSLYEHAMHEGSLSETQKQALDKEMGIHNESEKSLTVDAEMQLDDTFKKQYAQSVLDKINAPESNQPNKEEIERANSLVNVMNDMRAVDEQFDKTDTTAQQEQSNEMSRSRKNELEKTNGIAHMLNGVKSVVNPIAERAARNSDMKYKAQYKQEVSNHINDPSRGKPESDKEKAQREHDMKKFEQRHSYEHVYNLKKEVLTELKATPLTEQAKERLNMLEKALDAEKKEHDKKKEQEKSNEPKSRIEKRQLKKTGRKSKQYDLER
ncbi:MULTISPECIES: LPD25 domain-containing protein [Bacillus]|uniref:LPD25 domain-containing protein n=1 Tax=Bacillus amyloliquefaciens group TaxID=1938374 RepID=UPI0039E17C4E